MGNALSLYSRTRLGDRQEYSSDQHPSKFTLELTYLPMLRRGRRGPVGRECFMIGVRARQQIYRACICFFPHGSGSQH